MKLSPSYGGVGGVDDGVIVNVNVYVGVGVGVGVGGGKMSVVVFLAGSVSVCWAGFPTARALLSHHSTRCLNACAE